MKSIDASRELIHRAVELHVIDTDDVTSSGSVLMEAHELVEALEQEGWLTAPVVRALRRHVELEPLRGKGGKDETNARRHELSELDPEERRAIEVAAFARIALAKSLIDRSKLRALQKQTGWADEALVASGAIDQAQATEIAAVRDEPRLACTNCFAVVPPNHADDAPCPSCAGAWIPARVREPGTSTKKLDAATLEKFLGEHDFFGNYEILERLAEGESFVVSKARDLRQNRIVALKVLRGANVSLMERLRRFMSPGRKNVPPVHPSIATIHEVDELEGRAYYVMDHVEGQPLDQHVNERGSSPREVAALVRPLALAIQQFHVRGILHGNLRPSCVRVDAEGVPRLIDFGVTIRSPRSTSSSHARPGRVNEPFHASPEQAAGRLHDVDTRTDVYALGAILYELLTGEPPFAKLSGDALLVAIQEDQPDPLVAKNPSVDPDLAAIVAKAMSKRRERRYQTAAELALDLEAFEQGLPVVARPLPFLEGTWRAAKRRPLTPLLALALAATIAWAAVNSRARGARGVLAISPLTQIWSEEHRDDEREMLLLEFVSENPHDAAGQAQLAVLAAKRDLAKKLDDARKGMPPVAPPQDVSEVERKARSDAEATLAKAAAERARALLEVAEKSAREGDLLGAHVAFARARGALAKDDGLAADLEKKQAENALKGARRALEARELMVARLLIDASASLPLSEEQRADLSSLRAALASASSERTLSPDAGELESALLRARAGDVVRARIELERVRARIDGELELVEKRCAEQAATRLDDARRLLAAGDPAAALGRVREARQLHASDAATALASECERSIARTARGEAVAAVASGKHGAALASLERALELIEDADLRAALRVEHHARARLVDDLTLAGLVYVPAIESAKTGAFYVDEDEVTNRAYLAFVEAQGYSTDAWWDELARPLRASFGGAPRTWKDRKPRADELNQPVRGITVHEAKAFARWRSSVTKAKWRLPTEKEWEVAAGWDPLRGSMRAYPWGEVFAAGAIATGAKAPRDVGSTLADASIFGLLDVGGNVAEWVVRANGDAGTKGCPACTSSREAAAKARVAMTATPGKEPPREVLEWVGFRLVREID